MGQVLPISPASGSVLWVMGAVSLLPLGLLALFLFISYSATHVQFEVSPEGVRIRGDLYGRVVPASSLILARARQVNLLRDNDLRPAVRTNGIGMPGYQSGWFRLRDGEKALLFVTDKSNVIYVPTRDGYSLLLSPAEPQAFLSGLQSIPLSQ